MMLVIVALSSGAMSGGMDVRVRRATAEDAPALARLRWRWRVDELAQEALIERQAFLDFFTTWTIDHLAQYAVFVVEVEGQLAGMAWLHLADRVPSPNHLDRRSGDIQSVYILPEQRGRRAGAQLIETLLQHARNLELRYLTVHSAEAATGFYEKLGFVHEAQWLAYPDAKLR